MIIVKRFLSVVLFVCLFGSSFQQYWRSPRNLNANFAPRSVNAKQQAYTMNVAYGDMGNGNYNGNGNSNNNMNNNNNNGQATKPIFVTTPVEENLVTGINFDCHGKPTGPNKDPNYCDVFHACVYGRQLKTYVCPHVGERFYFNAETQRCEFSSQNPHACPSNNYYAQINNPNKNPTTTAAVNNNMQYSSPVQSKPVDNSMTYSIPKPTQEQVEPWRQYVRENEQFSCATNPDGFYPSRWCNVFYRCANYIKYEFLCAQMTNGDRAWWVQHSTNTPVTDQSQAQCVFPCVLNRQCTSPGGVLRDQGIVSSSTADAARILNQCEQPSSNGNPSVDASDDQFRLPNGGNNCAGVPDGGFISSSYCNVFHVCTGNRRRDFLCARASNSSTYELWWNEQTKQCDWPCKVSCSKPIFGSSSSAAQIQALDTSLNAALCGADNSMNNGYGSNNQYSNGNSQTTNNINNNYQQTMPMNYGK